MDFRKVKSREEKFSKRTGRIGSVRVWGHGIARRVILLLIGRAPWAAQGDQAGQSGRVKGERGPSLGRHSEDLPWINKGERTVGNG